MTLVLLLATPLLGQTRVAATSGGVLVAQPGTLQLFDRTAKKLLWSSASVQNPTAIATSNEQAAIIDALTNEVRIHNLTNGSATKIIAGETPVDGIFISSALYLLERDARALERIGRDGTRASISVAADPAFLRQSNGSIYVYSRLEGVLQEVSTTPFALRRSVKVAPFASDLEVDARSAYLVYPRAANVGVVTLQTMKSAGKIDVGAVPVDLAFASGSTALTAKMLAIADPSGKRVWLTDGTQSISQAIARGFLRGLLGLGLTGTGGSTFPTGVDRVAVRGAKWYGYDASSATLYRFTRRNSTVIAKDVGPAAFSVTAGGVYVWNEAVRRLQRLDAE